MKEKLFAPEFSEEQSDTPITVTEGGEVSLDVAINGKPKPDVKWYKDERILRESSRLDIKARGDKHSVVILGIKPEDSGVYKCEAKSKMGTSTRAFDVRVAGTCPYYALLLELFSMKKPKTKVIILANDGITTGAKNAIKP